MQLIMNMIISIITITIIIIIIIIIIILLLSSATSRTVVGCSTNRAKWSAVKFVYHKSMKLPFSLLFFFLWAGRNQQKSNKFFFSQNAIFNMTFAVCREGDAKSL